jgi:CSLREA domain-containing protein
MSRRTIRNGRRVTAAVVIALVGLVTLPGTITAGNTGQTFNVTKAADTNDGSCTPQDCSLREAVVAANANSDFDTIQIPAGHFTLAIKGKSEQAAATGDLDILNGVDIHGAGARKTIVDGGGIDRVFHVPYTGTSTQFHVWIENMTITGGISPNEPGGGIAHLQPTATLHLLKSTVRGNSANQGGGIENGFPFETTMIIDRSTISRNKAPGGQGGGIQNVGTLTIVNSTISGNRAFHGGGLINHQGTTDIEYSTIAFNVGKNGGGGIYLNSQGVTAEGTIIAKNISDFASLKNCTAALVSHGHNLENGDTCGMNLSSDISANPRLDTLDYYGGPTKTHRLLAGSPAIDHGGDTFPPTDQRGVDRPRNLVPDIGSYER